MRIFTGRSLKMHRMNKTKEHRPKSNKWGLKVNKVNLLVLREAEQDQGLENLEVSKD
jgi:hypothetical protein